MLLRANDAELNFVQRLQVRLHLTICGACRNFNKQVQFMSKAMGPWRAYRDDLDGPV